MTTARRTAWYKEEDDPCRDYNPFRKIHRPLKKPGDEEDTTGSLHSSNGLRPPGNEETITMPSTTNSASRDRSPSVKDARHENGCSSHEKGYYSDDTECETDIVSSETGSKDGRQKSRRRRFPFLRKSKRLATSSCKKGKQKFSAAGQLKATILNA